MRALGGRDSLKALSQRGAPMAIRKGIAGAAAAREAKRRREARENGVVLEREAPPAAERAPARTRSRSSAAVDLPAVGRLRGAELKLSKRDIRSMEGGDAAGRGPLKRRRRR